MTFEVRVDQDVCISSGRCVADFPAAFSFDEDEIAQVTGATALSEDERLEAVRGCPSGAIQLWRDGSVVPVTD